MNLILGKTQQLLAALMIASAPACFGQEVLAEYNLTGGTPLAPSTVNVTSASTITFGGFAGAWSEPSSGVLQEGPGAVTTPALAVAGGDYASFTLTSSTPMNLTSLTFGGGYGLFANPAGYALTTSVDGFASILSTAAFATQAPTFTTQTVDLSGASFQGLTSITFDVYGYVQNSGNLQFNDFVVNGSVGAVPEPNTLALVGTGLVGLFKLAVSRRRK